MGFDVVLFKRSISRLTIITAILLSFGLCACGGGGGGGGSDTSATTDPIEPSDVFTVSDEATLNALQAASFDDATDISIYRDSKQLINGDVIPAGSALNLGIKVQSADEISCVLAGNGGGYLVSAVYNQDKGMYVCSYQVPEKGILAPIIISAVHKDKKVSRKKIVLRTQNIPKANQLIRDGFGLLVGKNILAKAKGVKIDDLTVKELVPVSNSSRYFLKLTTEEYPVMPISFNLYDGLSGSGTSSVSPSLMIDSPLINLFSKSDLGLQSFLFEEESIKTGEGSEIDLTGLNLDKKPLYLVANGLPEETTDKMAALMLGLFMYEGGVKGVFPKGVTLFKSTPAIDFSKSSDDASSIELSLSDAGLTQLAATLFNGSIVAPAVPIDKIIPKYDSGMIVQKTRITLNNQGVAFDFSGKPMITINDLRIVYLENDIPVWEVSIDIAAYLDIASHNMAGTQETYIDGYLKLVPALTRMTIIKDAAGIKINREMIDALISDLKTKLPSDDPEMDFLVSIRTDSFGVPISSASISSNSKGRCLVKIKTISESLNFEKTGVCFIDSAVK